MFICEKYLFQSLTSSQAFNSFQGEYIYMKSSDAKASKCHLKFSSRMIIFIKLVYLSSVISLKLHLIGNLHCN